MTIFGAHKAKQEQKLYQHQLKDYEQHLAEWQQERDAYAELVETARDFDGDRQPDTDLVLKTGEALFLAAAGAILVEERNTGGHWQGGSHGISVPIGSIHGRSLRYRVGSTKGRYEPGIPEPKAIDVGTLYVTDQRVVYAGAKQTRECLFDKLASYHPEAPTITFSVSNRQRPTVIGLDPAVFDTVRFRVDLALAHHQRTVDQLVKQMESELAGIDRARPRPPEPPGSQHAIKTT